MLNRQPLKDRAQGRWRGILPAIGIPASFLTGKHGPCPLCGGKDRYRWDNKDGRGSWICSQCGAGDGISLVMQKFGWDFREAARQIDTVIGTSPAENAKPERSERDKRDAMNKLWRSGAPIQAGDPVARYLYARAGLTQFPPCLRTVASLRYAGERPSSHPAMIAMMTAPDGKATILHRTYLTADGRKADVEAPRRMMPGSIAKGSAVRLAEPTDVLGIAEGIETALSAAALFGVPCWAALTAGLLATWAPPEGMRRIIIFGDNDTGFAGQAAAYGLARRLWGADFTIDVEIPATSGLDWNDVHRARRTNDIAA
jgi:putative DNA primase/helicase